MRPRVAGALVCAALAAAACAPAADSGDRLREPATVRKVLDGDTIEVARGARIDRVRLIGVDAPSVDERGSRTLDVHHALFDGGAYVLENLDLRAVKAGRYELIALPQRLAGLDAAPVRALLRTAPPARR